MGLIKYNDGIDRDTFDEILNKNKVIIEFFTPWCAPCKRIDSILQELASKFPTIYFISINITESRWIQEKYPFFGVPTFFFVIKGKIIKKFTAGLEKIKFSELILKYFDFQEYK